MEVERAAWGSIVSSAGALLVVERFQAPVAEALELGLERGRDALELVHFDRLLFGFRRLVRHARVQQLGVQRRLQLLFVRDLVLEQQIDLEKTTELCTVSSSGAGRYSFGCWVSDAGSKRVPIAPPGWPGPHQPGSEGPTVAGARR